MKLQNAMVALACRADLEIGQPNVFLAIRYSKTIQP
jgi:hypothetical protein